MARGLVPQGRRAVMPCTAWHASQVPDPAVFSCHFGEKALCNSIEQRRKRSAIL
jgi:hypothetical protein